MKKIISMLLACAVALTSLAACGSAPVVEPNSPASTPVADTPGSEPANQPDEPTASDGLQVSPLSNLQELIPGMDLALHASSLSGNEDLSPLGNLSFNLYGQTDGAKSLKNNVFSPISAAIALGMLYEGTNGETANELESVIGWSKSDALDLFNALMYEYAGINSQTDTTLNLANAAFFSPRLKNPDDATIINLRDGYRAQMFRGELSTDSAREFINSWVSEKTEGEIPSVLGENLDPSTVMVLINTILLDAKWAQPFINYGVEITMPFTCANGETAELPCLADTRNMSYIDTEELTGAIMDYSDGRLKFMAVKPKDGDISKLMEKLDYSYFTSALASAREGNCYFLMPKFSIESEIDLNDCVKELGAKLIFDPDNADLTGFGESDNGNVFVSEIFQKAKIDVDEEGTRAAAATMVIANDACAIMEIKEIKLDSSFFWCVYDGKTNLPLFMGVMTGNE